MKLLVAIVLLGALLALGWFLLTPDGAAAIPNTVKAVHADDAPAIEEPVGAGNRGEELERSAIAETNESVDAQEDEASLAVVVRVVLDTTDDAPLEDVLVQLYVGDTKRRVWVEQRTDAEGYSHFELRAAARIYTARVATGPRNAAHEEHIGRGVDAAHASGVELRVSSGATLAGRVVDPQGSPVPNAELRVWATANYDATRTPDLTGVADGSGAFELFSVPAVFMLVASAPGKVCDRGLRGELRAGSRASDLDVVLTLEAWLEGTVLDSLGRPVETCQLHVDASGSRGTQQLTHVANVSYFAPVSADTRSGVDGRFRLGPVPARPWIVRASHTKHLTQHQSLETTNVDQVIVLPAGGMLVGRVLARDGEPVSGAQLRTLVGGEFSRRGVSEADGRFELHGVSPGSGSFAVHAEGHRIALVPIDIVQGNVTSVDVLLDASLRVAGQVLDADGAPVPRANLHIMGDRLIEMSGRYGEPTTVEWLFGLQKVRADDEGRFIFDGLAPGTYKLNAAVEDAPLERVELEVQAGQENLRVVIDPSAIERVVFMGRVIALPDGEPVTRFSLSPTLMNPDGSGFGALVEVEDPDGRFRSAGHAPGTYILSAKSEGFASWRSEELVLAEGEHEFEIGLMEGRSVELELVDLAGKPLQEPSRVTFSHEDQRLWFSFASGSANTAFPSDGRVHAHGLPAAVVTATVTSMMTDEASEHVLDLRIQPHEPIRIVVEAKPPFELSCIAMGTRRESDAPPEGEGWPFDAELTAAFFTSSGNQLGVALVRPLGGGVWSLQTSTMHGQSSTPDARTPRVSATLPGSTTRMELTAKGYRPRTITLDALSPNGGVLDVIFLRRVD